MKLDSALTFVASDPIETHPRRLYSTEDLPLPVTAIRYYLPIQFLEHGSRKPRYHYCSYLFPMGTVEPVGFCQESCAGHATPEEAREHYRQYLLSRFAQFKAALMSPSTCSLCGRRTMHFAWVEFHYEWDRVPLCPSHMNLAGLDQCFIFKDYHLLQISDPRAKDFATVSEHDAPICVVKSPRPQQPKKFGEVSSAEAELGAGTEMLD